MARQRWVYTTDLTDEEWQILKPLLPPEKSGGRPRKYALREVCAARRLCLAPDAA
jgi:putative transposase